MSRVNAAPRPKKDVARGRSAYKARYAYEKIDLPDEEMLKTEWIPPSKEVAKEYMRSKMFKNGRASLCTRMSSLDFLGVGTGLYFRLIKYLAMTFFFMSILALPAIVICRSGNRIPEEDVDPLSMNLFSLANIGNAERPECENWWTQSIGGDAALCNVTTIDVLGYDVEATQVSVFIAYSDFAYSVAFVLFMLFLRNRITYLVRVVEKDIVTISDYAVMVKGLPLDATTAEVRDHFSKLYNLKTDDWIYPGYCCGCIGSKTRRRQTLDYALRYNIEMAVRYQGATVDAGQTALIDNGPVEDVSNTRDFSYRGSWVAEVVLAHPNGTLMRKYKQQTARLGKIRVLKATMKKYKPDAKEPNAKKYRKAERNKMALIRKLDKFDDVNAKNLSDKCVGAFVTFNCEDSRRWCLEDYHKSTSMWGRYWQPEPLLFRGKHALEVTPAVEPSDVIWENMETTRPQRCRRQAAVYFLMLVLIIGSIIAMAFAQNKKQEFERKVPNLDVCDVDLPALAYLDRSTPVNELDFSEIPEDAVLVQQETNDCPNDFFKILYETPDGVQPNEGWNCVDVAVDPTCVSPDDTHACETLRGLTFPRSSVVGCYCLATLNALIDEHGVFSGAKKLIDEESDACLDFALNYTLAQALLLFAAGMVVFTNTALKVVLRRVTNFERHETFTAHERAIAIKVFFAQFLNTGLVVLIVNAKISSGLPDEVGVFAGEFKSFEPEWYSVVGVSIVITMLINIIAPHLLPFFHMMLACCKRTKRRFRKMVTQEQVDHAYKPRSFLLSTRFPVILNTVFVTMAYAAGLPILLPIGFVSFVLSFWVDKITLLRLYGKPPFMKEDLALFSQRLMPWALFIHLGISIWMYGDPDTLESDPVNLRSDKWEEEYEKWVNGQGSKYDEIDLVPKLMRENVFPIAVLLFLLLFVKLLYRYIGRPVKLLIHKVLYYSLCCWMCKQDLPPPKHHKPRFTGPFVVRLGPFDKNASHLTEKEHSRGWRVVDDPTRGSGAKAKVKVWRDTGTEYGIPHRMGQTKNTWEVVAEEHLPTYAPIINPSYTPIITALLDGTDKVHGKRLAAMGSHRWTQGPGSPGGSGGAGPGAGSAAGAGTGAVPPEHRQRYFPADGGSASAPSSPAGHGFESKGVSFDDGIEMVSVRPAPTPTVATAPELPEGLRRSPADVPQEYPSPTTIHPPPPQGSATSAERAAAPSPVYAPNQFVQPPPPATPPRGPPEDDATGAASGRHYSPLPLAHEPATYRPGQTVPNSQPEGPNAV